MRNTLPFLFLLALASPVAAQPLDQAAPRLSDRGRKVVSGELGGYFSTDDQYTSTPRYDTYALYVRPAFTYFLLDRVGLGGSLAAGASGGGHSTRSDFGLGIHALYDVVLSSTVSLFIIPGLGYWGSKHHETFQPKPTGGVYPTGQTAVPIGYDASYVRAALSVPLAIHVSSSVALGFGPDLWFDHFLTRTERLNGSSARSNRVQVGMSTWIGVSF